MSDIKWDPNLGFIEWDLLADSEVKENVLAYNLTHFD